jgi:hypothetical protein
VKKELPDCGHQKRQPQEEKTPPETADGASSGECSAERTTLTGRGGIGFYVPLSPSAPESLTSIGRNETTDFDITAKTDIPNDGFAKRVSGVSKNGLFRDPPPRTIDWNPISSRSHVVLRAMPIGNVAAGNASRTAHAFEPSANVVRDIFKLSVVDCESSSGEEGQRHEKNKLRGLPHRDPRHISHANEARITIWPQDLQVHDGGCVQDQFLRVSLSEFAPQQDKDERNGLRCG